MSPLGKKIVLGISLLVVAYAATGYMLGRSPDDKAFRALTVYSEVLEHIQRDYVDEPNMHAVTNGSLHGLLDSLDPQSAYLSPLEYKDFKEKSASNPPARVLENAARAMMINNTCARSFVAAESGRGR